ncbi:MAG: 1-acyl-sn-glycerol-3-phosphate acyltransferase [Arenimonas sp.]|nr:1-acyl-sn-glycerol-3-phosphate acyltransferase [Arenimonas sp.]
MTRVTGTGSDMFRHINYHWRQLATGSAFLLFGIGGALLWLVVFPILHILVRDKDKRGSLARLIVHHSFAFFFTYMHRMGILTYEINGLERLQRTGLLILANHPTLIDIVMLISLLKNADCVVRSGLAKNIATRGAVGATGYICNDNGPDLIANCIKSVKSGKNLIIFPEGSRSKPLHLLPFQRGAANIAVRGLLNITPVLIKCSPATLSKGLEWYNIPSRRFHISIHVLPDIPVANFCDETEALAARKLTDYLSNYFTTELNRANA